MTTIAKVTKLPICNFDCERPAKYDFRTNGGSWAYGCSMHYIRHRMYRMLGTGKGQELRLEVDPEVETMTCYKCEGDPEVELTGKTRVVEVQRDPTETYELKCGHWMI